MLILVKIIMIKQKNQRGQIYFIQVLVEWVVVRVTDFRY